MPTGDRESPSGRTWAPRSRLCRGSRSAFSWRVRCSWRAGHFWSGARSEGATQLQQDRKEESCQLLLATPLGIGGIGVVRLSGPAALFIVQRVFVRSNGEPCTSLKSHRVYHGFVVNGAGERVDEVLLCLMRRPHSYTREDVVEISCHGGIMTTQRVLEAVLAQGTRASQWWRKTVSSR